MKQKIVILLLVIFCLSETRFVFPFFEYLFNYEYISRELCINKNIPESDCHGKCYLNKKIKDIQETDTQNSNLPDIKFERIPMIVFSYEIPTLLALENIYIENNFYYLFNLENYISSPPTPPPKC